MTIATNKVLLPVHDKPMLFYPLDVLMQAGIRDILVISTPRDLPSIKRLLEDGSSLGLNLSYAEEPEPKGSAEVFNIGREFIGNDAVTVIYGDNVIYGEGLSAILKDAAGKASGATIFGFPVDDPRRFGVIEFDQNNKVISIEEKPSVPKSNYAIVGLYCYDCRALDFVKNVKLSERGEMEITSVIQMYLENDDLEVKTFGKDYAWLDTGTVQALAKANELIRSTEEALGRKIAVLEETAYRNGWIGKDKLLEAANRYSKTSYGQYLLSIAQTS